MKFFPLIWRNLWRRRLRTLLTVLSIAVAFLLYGYLSAIRAGLLAGVEVAGQDRLVVRHKVSIIQTLPVSYLARISRIPGVKHVLTLPGLEESIRSRRIFSRRFRSIPRST